MTLTGMLLLTVLVLMSSLVAGMVLVWRKQRLAGGVLMALPLLSSGRSAAAVG